MTLGRPIPPLTLTEKERETIERWVRRRKTTQALAQRVRIVLACAVGKTNTTAATKLHITNAIVGKWRAYRAR